jgi:hypothetical protein
MVGHIHILRKRRVNILIKRCFHSLPKSCKGKTDWTKKTAFITDGTFVVHFCQYVLLRTDLGLRCVGFIASAFGTNETDVELGRFPTVKFGYFA